MSLYDSLKKTISKNKVLVKNFSSLSILQISQYIFPLITFPYITRVLEPEKFGLVHFAYLFIAYFNTIIEFGFNISATQKVAIHKSNSRMVSKIFWEVFYIKMFLFIVSSILFLLILYSFDTFASFKELYIYAYFSVIGTILFPQWFFMGIEKMHYIILFNFPFKVLYTISVFVFVLSSNDWKTLVVLNTITMTLIGITGFVFTYIKFRISFCSLNFNDLIKIIYESSKIFVSTFSISFYSSNNIFLLGLFTDTKILGLFVVADKIRLIMQVIPHSISESFFPFISNLFDLSRTKGIKKIKIYTILVTIISLLIAIFGYFNAELIIKMLVGEKFLDAVIYLKILTWVPLIVALRDTLGKHIMLNIGMKNEYARVYILALILSLLLTFIFVPYYFALSTSIILLFTEILICYLMFRKVKTILV